MPPLRNRGWRGVNSRCLASPAQLAVRRVVISSSSLYDIFPSGGRDEVTYPPGARNDANRIDAGRLASRGAASGAVGGVPAARGSSAARWCPGQRARRDVSVMIVPSWHPRPIRRTAAAARRAVTPWPGRGTSGRTLPSRASSIAIAVMAEGAEGLDCRCAANRAQGSPGSQPARGSSWFHGRPPFRREFADGRRPAPAPEPRRRHSP